MTNVLIVDDQEDLRRNLERAAKAALRKGYDLSSVTTEAEALEKINSEEKGFDLVITDLALDPTNNNDTSGLNVVDAVKQKNPYSQVIVVSSDAYELIYEGKAAEAMVRGAYDYILRGEPDVNYMDKLREVIPAALEFKKKRERLRDEGKKHASQTQSPE